MKNYPDQGKKFEKTRYQRWDNNAGGLQPPGSPDGDPSYVNFFSIVIEPRERPWEYPSGWL